MSNPANLDQGGTPWGAKEHWMGPSVGWWSGYQATPQVIADGVTRISLGTSIINVSVIAPTPPIVFNVSAAGNAGAVNPFLFTLPAVAANALCVIAILPNQGAPVVSVADGVGAYTAAGQDTLTSNNAKEALYYAYRTVAQPPGGTLTITQTSTGSNISGIFAAFTGFASAQIDTGGTYIQNAANTPTWTTTVSRGVAVGAIGPNSGALTPGTSGWNALSGSSFFSFLVYKILSAPLSAETLGADGSSGYFSSVVTAFK